MKKLLFALLLLAGSGLCGVPSAQAVEPGTLVQVATIDALLAGLYDGVATIGSLKSQGDLGIGTFDALDGEMVLLDGQVYRVSADGTAAIVPDQETTPFASLTMFDADQTIAVPPGTDYAGLRALVDKAVPSPNLFYAFRLEGRFTSLSTRSVPRQSKPYKQLVEVVKNQPVFEFQNLDGTLVGFYCPAFVTGINVPGYHLHFLNSDHSAGGHLLGFKIDHATLQIDTLNRFILELPENEGFASVDLQQNRKAELEKVEK